MVIDFSAIKYTKDSSNELDSINIFYYLISDFYGFLTFYLLCGLRCKGSDALKGLLRAFLVGFKTTTLS